MRFQQKYVIKLYNVALILLIFQEIEKKINRRIELV